MSCDYIFYATQGYSRKETDFITHLFFIFFQFFSFSFFFAGSKKETHCCSGCDSPLADDRRQHVVGTQFGLKSQGIQEIPCHKKGIRDIYLFIY
jgi:hypothetical protein